MYTGLTIIWELLKKLHSHCIFLKKSMEQVNYDSLKSMKNSDFFYNLWLVQRIKNYKSKRVLNVQREAVKELLACKSHKMLQLQ